MKQKITTAFLILSLSLAARAESALEIKQAALSETKSRIEVLCRELEVTNDPTKEYSLRLSLRAQFNKMDQLIASSSPIPSSIEMRPGALRETIGSIDELTALLDQSNDPEELFEIRAAIRDQFSKMDQLIMQNLSAYHGR